MDGLKNMEHDVVGGQSNVLRSLSSSSPWRLWFLVFISQVIWAVSERNMQIIDPSTVLGVWNQTLQKDMLHCSNFHEVNASGFIFYWPEDSFHYCCDGTAPKQNLSDYRYSMFGNSIMTAVYWDLGLIDNCGLYYTRKCLNLLSSYKATPVYYTGCEWNDVAGLYIRRFWKRVVFKYGLAATALPLIVSLQLSVCLEISLEVIYWRYWRSKPGKSKVMETFMPRKKLKRIISEWFYNSWKNAWMDWLHLCLLSIIGTGLVEAVGHTNPDGWQASLFHGYSAKYFALSVILWLSSFLHQVAHWIATEEKVTRTENQEKAKHEHDPGSHDRDSLSQSACCACGPAIARELRTMLKVDEKENKSKDPVLQLRKLLQLGPDWKSLPISAQSTIFFCLLGYLTYPNYVEEDSFSSTLLVFVVQAASPWSGIYACRVLFQTVPFLLTKIFNLKHIRHLVLKKILLHRRRKSKVTPADLSIIIEDRLQEAQLQAEEELLEKMHWGRVLCCMGCCWKSPQVNQTATDPESLETSQTSARAITRRSSTRKSGHIRSSVSH